MLISKQFMDTLVEEIAHTEEHLKKLKDVQHHLQKVCDHKFVYSGRDSHYDYEACEFCYKEQRA